ncbi:MAG TPA: succinylglutamate desuccinylase/aspartoacylase family protein [Steroidobacteraceae bacterium]|nr:succinylglutamate desuccinylase/aspartoacylase family protein [Steroidobacteraceae bacterium]
MTARRADATMPAMPFRAAAILSVLACLRAAAAAADVVVIPPGIVTHGDGRAPIESLYRASLGLVEKGWTAEVVVTSSPPGTTTGLPVIALRSPKPGPAVWILAGIHGEEPAGPNAVAAAIDDIALLGEHRAVVLMPLLNPHGYARNWRYLNTATYSESVDGQSVGDSSHLLPSTKDPAKPRAAAASSPEAGAITAWILARQADYPALISLDLHEDNLIDEGYVYSQGAAGAADEQAKVAVAVLRDQGVPIKMGGTTRFDEPIERGVIGPVTDSSVDELMSAREVLVGGERRPGPGARTVVVLETPAAALPLAQRVGAHAALLRTLAKRLLVVDYGY